MEVRERATSTTSLAPEVDQVRNLRDCRRVAGDYSISFLERRLENLRLKPRTSGLVPSARPNVLTILPGCKMFHRRLDLKAACRQLPVFSNGLSQDDIAHPREGKSSVSSGARLCCRSEPAELSIVTHRWHIVVEAPRDMHECSECLLFLAASLRRVEG